MTLSKGKSRTARSKSLSRETSDRASTDFDALFQEHWEKVCRVVYSLVGDWDEAEDLALDAFWQLHRRPPASDYNLSGWLYRVATNLGLNALRSRRRRKQYEEEAASLIQSDDPSWNPAEIFEKAQEKDRVRGTLLQMKPQSAQALILHHSGFSYVEIAQVLELKSTSIGTLLARAEREFEDRIRKLEGG